jgi:hypothetical protein
MMNVSVKRVLLMLVISALSSAVLAGASLLCEQKIAMQDYEAIRYGFPYSWLEHVTVNFAGMTDSWFLETSNLIKNMVLYFLLSLDFLLAVFLVKYCRQRIAGKG